MLAGPADNDQPCFAMVEARTVARIGPTAAILLARITWRAEHRDGSWRASRRTLAEETGLTPAMLRTATQVLLDQGLVQAERTSADDPTVIWSVTCVNAESAPPLAESATPPCDISNTPLADSAITSYKTDGDLETTTTSPAEPVLFDASDEVEKRATPALRVVPPPAADLDAEFDAFWGHYPRRVGKKAAHAAFVKARKTTSLEDIARGLMAQLSGQLAGDTKFVPHPATWLNQGRWADDVQRPRSATRSAFSDPMVLERAEQELAARQRRALS